MDYRVLSIGALSRHELWGETTPTRTAHATCTLVRTAGRVIVVDPGLPPQVIEARLTERSGLLPRDVTDVFLTTFRPAHRWGLGAFEHAAWWIGHNERETVGGFLVEQFQAAEDEQAAELLKQDIATLQRCQPADDKLAPQVDLFPLPGYTAGTTGLLLLHANTTTLIAGDAVPTIEHLEQGKALRSAYDAQAALESLKEAVEIADIIIPGHDNIVFNPSRRAM
jgi:glyoxylase-like metal-dependent hydrolase (beta-lactamase superfamily II)